ncbi:MAG TPA: hypothetical protein VGR37_22590 [Longimicrobiaceae bacterium]|nr:hypothetical protein [Longimicrobiaceae bacterium]
MEGTRETISRIEPLADAVVDAATALKAAIRTACEHGLTVRVDVQEEFRDGDDEPVPLVRARISRRIA